MIFTDRRVPASGPKSDVKIAAIGMSPAKWELADGRPFTGASGKIFDDALAASKVARAQVYVTNLVNFFIDDNDLYSVPKDIMDQERSRVFREIDDVKPNCLIIMGGDTLHLLTGRQGIVKWRGSILEIECPSGRRQKCVAAMHPAAFIRGQWKWLPIFKYIDVPRAVTQSSSPALALTQRNCLVAPSFQTAKEYLLEAMHKDWVSIDYEGRKHISCLGFGWSATEALCIPMSRVGNPSYWSLEEEIELWQLWCALLQRPTVRKIAQNASYEWIKSWLYGIHPNPLGMDTMHMHHCLYPDFGGITDEWSRKKRDIDNPGHGLAFITSQYTDQPYYKDDGRHWTPALGEESFWRYNCLDVMVTFEAAMKMRSELEKGNLWQTYEHQYLDVFESSLRMEWFGIMQDTQKRDATHLELKQELVNLGSQLKESTGYEKVVTKSESKKPDPKVLNLKSPKQMQHFLYAQRGYKPKLNKKTKKITVDKDTLQALAIAHNDPALKAIVKMQGIQHFINNVINARLDSENRIHCHHRIGGTNGTRWSTTESILESGTNLQNLPRQGPGRSFFLPT